MKNIYVIYGENFEAINDYEKNIAKNYLKEVDEFNYIKINMQENTLETLVYECRSSGLFGNEKVVVAENCNFLLSKPKKIKVEHNIDTLSNYIDNISKEVVLILKITDKIDSRKKLIKKILTLTKFVLNVERFMQQKISMLRNVNVEKNTDLQYIKFFRIKRRMRILFITIFLNVLVVGIKLNQVL